ncbi:MAG: hypothetical protein DWQ30_13090 [Acidobacteria bacterium]|nr:MAG: hypothetical protein DWQ30_13090 [Acidobacteriota bacterium]
MNLPLGAGPLAAIGFVCLVAFLFVYSIRHWRRRAEEMEQQMPLLGYSSLAEPTAAELLPDLLFHPHRFAGEEGSSSRWGDLRRHVRAAWRGELAGQAIVVADISVDRQRPEAGPHREHRTHQLNRTVVRCQLPPPHPPDFLIEEQVLLKSQVRGAVPIDGQTLLPEHYFVYSRAGSGELEGWVDGGLRDQLARHRLWEIATHDGVLFMTRNHSWQKPDEMQGFLAEAEAFLGCILAGHARR